MPTRRTSETVLFSSLKIGDKFFCWGDQNLNYDYPKICECIKTGEQLAEELEGMSFLIDKSDKVFINN